MERKPFILFTLALALIVAVWLYGMVTATSAQDTCGALGDTAIIYLSWRDNNFDQSDVLPDLAKLTPLQAINAVHQQGWRMIAVETIIVGDSVMVMVWFEIPHPPSSEQPASSAPLSELGAWPIVAS